MGSYKLQLGVFTFDVHELPEDLPLGGEQQLAVRKFPGGLKSIQSLGAFEAPIEWSGEFLYEGALDRAEVLDELRKAGKPLTLSWGPITRQVVIEQFTFKVKNPYWLIYSIKLEIVQEPAIMTPPAQDPIVSAAVQVAVATPAAPPPAKTYTVQPGDCLTKIGSRYGIAWQKIFQANTDKIKNPNLIRVGQVLVIPSA